MQPAVLCLTRDIFVLRIGRPHPVSAQELGVSRSIRRAVMAYPVVTFHANTLSVHLRSMTMQTSIGRHFVHTPIHMAPHPQSRNYLCQMTTPTSHPTHAHGNSTRLLTRSAKRRGDRNGTSSETLKEAKFCRSLPPVGYLPFGAFPLPRFQRRRILMQCPPNCDRHCV